MRIGLRIMLGYLLVLGVLSAALLVGLPRIVRRALQSATGPVLVDQAIRFGARLDMVRDPATYLTEIEQVLGAEVVVTDPQGRVIHEALRPLPDGKRPPSLLGKQVPANIIMPALQGKTRTFYGNLFGTAAVAGIAPVHQSSQVAGAIIVWRGYSFATQSVREITSEVFTWMVAGLVLAGLLSYLLTQGIVNRLRRVGGAASALAAGDLAVRAPENDYDELGELGQNFNHMAARIQGLVEGLQKSERLRRELMAAISHELRTPITSIQGFAEALRDGIVREPDQQRRYHEIIVGESERLSRLVRDLFDFAKLEAGQFDFRLVPMDPRSWLTDFCERTRTRLEPLGLRLELWGDPGGEPILGDQQRLEQVLVNLVDNAARYSTAGGTITVSAECLRDGLRLSVQDQGPGIKPEDLPRVFDRFYQGTTDGNKAGGAGLGLAIAQSIVAGHGGQIGVTSEPGQGACFWFTLRPA